MWPYWKHQNNQNLYFLKENLLKAVIVQKMNYLKHQKMMRWPLRLLFSLLNQDLLPVQELLIVQLQAVVLQLQITHGWHGFASLSVFYLSSCFWLTSSFVQRWHVHALKVRSLKRNPRSMMIILSMNHNTGKIIQAYSLRISIRSVKLLLGAVWC